MLTYQVQRKSLQQIGNNDWLWTVILETDSGKEARQVLEAWRGDDRTRLVTITKTVYAPKG